MPVICTCTHAYQGVRNVTFPGFADLLNGSFLFWNLRFTNFSITFLGVNFSRSKTSFFAILASTNQFTNYFLVYLVKLNSCEFSYDHSLQKHIDFCTKSEKKSFSVKLKVGLSYFFAGGIC